MVNGDCRFETMTLILIPTGGAGQYAGNLLDMKWECMMKTIKIGLFLGVVGVLWAHVVGANEIGFGGQLRPRFEFRNPVGGGHDHFTSMRVRAHLTASLAQDVDVFVQVQDVRLWGEETNTLGDYRADNFDLHQGYVRLKNMNGSAFSLKIGRQAISMGGQRLIGAVEWTQQGRAFDGVLLGVEPTWGSVQVMGIRLADASASGVSNNAYLAGVYATLKAASHTSIDVYSFYDRVSGGVDTRQWTLGTRWYGKTSGFVYRVEGSFQTGDRSGQEVSAFMFGVRGGKDIGTGNVTLWYDYLSGDENMTDAKVKVFDTMYATNHKFYGFADLFLNIPAHTGGLGLQDLAIKTSFTPAINTTLAIDGHAFFVAQKGVLGSSHLADEVDVTLSYRYSPNVVFVGGYSYVFAQDGIKALGRLAKNMSYAYLMTNVSF